MLRSTEVHPVFFWFVLPFCLLVPFASAKPLHWGTSFCSVDTLSVQFLCLVPSSCFVFFHFLHKHSFTLSAALLSLSLSLSLSFLLSINLHRSCFLVLLLSLSFSFSSNLRSCSIHVLVTLFCCPVPLHQCRIWKDGDDRRLQQGRC